MFRTLLLALAAVTLQACSPAPAMELPSEPELEPSQDDETTMANPFHTALRSLRKKFDLHPFVEILDQVVPALTPAGTVYELSFQRPYALVVGEVTAWSHGGGAALELPFDVTYKILSADQGRRAAINHAVIGSPASSWMNWANGRKFGEQDPVTFSVTTRTAADATPGRLQLLVRGYRLWPKGTVSPIQSTLAELAKLGESVDTFTEAVRLIVPTSTDETSQQFTFQDDYVVRGLTISDGTDTVWGANRDTAVVRIDADRPLFSDSAFASRYALAGSNNQTAWWFPQPIRIAKNTVWNFRAKHLAIPGVATTLDFVLHGGRIHRRGK